MKERRSPREAEAQSRWVASDEAALMSAGDLHVEARDRDTIVTMPGTSFRVVYRKPDRGLQLGKARLFSK